MPQEQPYFLKVNDSTTVEVAARRLPDGFYELSPYEQDSTARQLLVNHIEQIQESQRPVTAKDILIPIAILIIIAAVIMLIARKIQKNPKVYDKVVGRSDQ